MTELAIGNINIAHCCVFHARQTRQSNNHSAAKRFGLQSHAVGFVRVGQSLTACLENSEHAVANCHQPPKCNAIVQRVWRFLSDATIAWRRCDMPRLRQRQRDPGRQSAWCAHCRIGHTYRAMNCCYIVLAHRRYYAVRLNLSVFKPLPQIDSIERSRYEFKRTIFSSAMARRVRVFTDGYRTLFYRWWIVFSLLRRLLVQSFCRKPVLLCWRVVAATAA